MFVLGLLCLGWTLMAAKVFELSMSCGENCSMKRMSLHARAFPQCMVALALTTFLLLDGRLRSSGDSSPRSEYHSERSEYHSERSESE